MHSQRAAAVCADAALQPRPSPPSAPLTACRCACLQAHASAAGAGAQKDLSLKDPLGQLSNVKMCVMCQAMGTVKRQYGFRVMDEQCEACNGARVGGGGGVGVGVGVRVAVGWQRDACNRERCIRTARALA